MKGITELRSAAIGSAYSCIKIVCGLWGFVLQCKAHTKPTFIFQNHIIINTQFVSLHIQQENS